MMIWLTMLATLMVQGARRDVTLCGSLIRRLNSDYASVDVCVNTVHESCMMAHRNQRMMGLMMESWRQSDVGSGAGISFYGHRDDVGTPGYRLGGPLPVSLSKFRPVRNQETGHVDITWITESELNNAGFNILRS